MQLSLIHILRIKLYDFSRLFYVTKRVKKYANVEVMPQIEDVYKRQIFRW